MDQPDRIRAVTLHDVAREAGVAVSTVSRALANPDRVSERTRAHVRAVAERLGYRPNLIARALPSGRTRMLALLVPDITNPHNVGVVRGAEARAADADYTLVLGDGRESPERELAHTRRLGSAVDGFVLVSSRLPDDDIRTVRARHPVVLFNRELDDIPSVVTDSADGGRQTVEHLAGLGHRHLAHLGGPSNAWSDGERWRGLTGSAERLGVRLTRLGPFSPTVSGGAAAADAGLGSGATALVCFNDLLAIGVLRRLEERGVAVPGQLSVTGVDDVFGTDFCHPPLTTLTSPTEAAGRLLIDMLLGTSPAERAVLPTPLHVRESTGPARWTP